MCPNFGTPKINFTFATNEKLMALGVSTIKHITVIPFYLGLILSILRHCKTCYTDSIENLNIIHSFACKSMLLCKTTCFSTFKGMKVFQRIKKFESISEKKKTTGKY